MDIGRHTVVFLVGTLRFHDIMHCCIDEMAIRDQVPARALLQRRRSSLASPRDFSEAPSNAQPGDEQAPADLEVGRRASLVPHTRRSTLGPLAGGWAPREPDLSDATGLVKC